MVTNNLLLKLKERNKENIEKARDVLRSMNGKIDVLRGLQVETDIRCSGSSYDILLVTQFSTMEDLEAYLVHPAHVEVSVYIAGVVESSAAVCYEA